MVNIKTSLQMNRDEELYNLRCKKNFKKFLFAKTKNYANLGFLQNTSFKHNKLGIIVFNSIRHIFQTILL